MMFAVSPASPPSTRLFFWPGCPSPATLLTFPSSLMMLYVVVRPPMLSTTTEEEEEGRDSRARIQTTHIKEIPSALLPPSHPTYRGTPNRHTRKSHLSYFVAPFLLLLLSSPSSLQHSEEERGGHERVATARK